MTTTATAPAPVDFPAIVLRAIGAISFLVSFEGLDAERIACEFIDRKVRQDGSSISYFEPVTVADQYEEVWERMSCEHGMSYSLCHGPQHYAYDEDERAFYGM